jgi:O-antigen/teichoic acid export membrane protein
MNSAPISTLRRLVGERRNLVMASAGSLALRIGGLISGFALGVVLARSLGPAEFGIYGLVTTVAALAMALIQIGTPQLAVRELSQRSAAGDWAGVRAIGSRFGVAVGVAGGGLGIIAVGVAAATGSATTMMFVVEGAILAFLMAYTGLLGAELRGLGALLKGQVMDIAVRPALSFLVVVAVLLAGKAMSAALALTILNAVALAAVAVSLIWLWRLIPSQPRESRPATPLPPVSAAARLGAIDLLRNVDAAYGVVLVGWLASDVELGIYRVAVACVVLASMPVTIFHITLAPNLSRLHSAGATAEMQRLLSWSAAAMTAIMVPIALGAWFFGRLVVGQVFGEAYGDAWLPLFVLTLAQLVYAVFGMGPIVLAMCGGEKALTRIYMIAVGAGLAVAIPLTMRWGGAGAACGLLVSAMIIGLMSRRHALSALGVEIAARRAR